MSYQIKLSEQERLDLIDCIEEALHSAAWLQDDNDTPIRYMKLKHELFNLT